MSSVLVVSERRLNSMFLALISKIPGIFDMKDFCPISLMGSIYRIIAVVLVNRLTMVLEKIISKS